SSSLPIIGRRLPASSSFVLAATPAPGAPAGPRTARRHKPATTRKSHNNSHPARRPENHTSPGQTTAPLDSNDPHGCTDAPPRDSLGAYLARPGGHRIIGLNRDAVGDELRRPAGGQARMGAQGEG